MTIPEEKKEALLALSHALGVQSRPLAILGEGNTSAKLSDQTFLVKASGSSLGTLTAADVVECHSAPLLGMLERGALGDQTIEDELFASRVDRTARKPSVEALFHAWLLTLPGVNFVGHTHAPAVTAVLCSPRAKDFATRRIFPDEVVCCGLASVFVPYMDPGLSLARAIRRETESFMADYGTVPRVILLENHGPITLGGTPAAVLAAMLMAEKAAGIFLSAAALGGPKFLTGDAVHRIASRIDEHYRQKALQL